MSSTAIAYGAVSFLCAVTSAHTVRTEIAYAAVLLRPEIAHTAVEVDPEVAYPRIRYAASGTDIAYDAMNLNAMSGTEIAYAAMSLLFYARLRYIVWSYALATLCLVPTSAMLLPGAGTERGDSMS
eukprot:2948588-Rhodomonas_salina.1